MSGAHSELPPSGAKAWRQCALWVTMNRLYPKPATPESMEGDAAHWAFQELLAGRVIAEGQIAPNGVVISEEMIDGGELFVETVHARMPVERFGTPQVEVPVAIPRIHAKCWGTPDTNGFELQPLTLEILDYKFGHRFVDEYENDQCIAYASGLIDQLAAKLGYTPAQLDQVLRVNITVVQPRCYYKGSPVRTWSVMASDLRGHINKLAMAAEAALGPNPIPVTNSECGDCAGRHACPALQLAAYNDAEFSAQSSPVDLSPAAADLELKMLERALQRLTARVEGLQESVGAYIKQGHPVQWHSVEQGYGRQQWCMPAEQVIAMGVLFNADLSKTGVKTPKQAARMLVDDAVIKAYTVTPLGQLKLIPNNPADARRVFGITT